MHCSCITGNHLPFSACCGQASNDADSESGKSNDSEFSTEPWFCDACRANCTPVCSNVVHHVLLQVVIMDCLE